MGLAGAQPILAHKSKLNRSKSIFNLTYISITCMSFPLTGRTDTMRGKGNKKSLAKRYQEMLDSGVLPEPVANPGRFSYPSMLVSVPSISTNSTNDQNTQFGVGNNFAKLERGS
jgi:hypothetical protein